MKKKKQFIDLEDNRYGLFMSDESFDLDVEYGRSYLETDNIQYVILRKINIIETKSHHLYGQAKSKDRKYMTPIKLNVMINVGTGEQKNYGDYQGGIVRDDVGNLVFGIYLKELKEHNIEIDRGDIIEYNMSGEKNRYFEVESANNVTDETNKTIGGFKPYWKRITCVPIKSDTFNFDDGILGENLM